jgi:hypothetical protein
VVGSQTHEQLPIETFYFFEQRGKNRDRAMAALKEVKTRRGRGSFAAVSTRTLSGKKAARAARGEKRAELTRAKNTPRDNPQIQTENVDKPGRRFPRLVS